MLDSLFSLDMADCLQAPGDTMKGCTVEVVSTRGQLKCKRELQLQIL